MNNQIVYGIHAVSALLDQSPERVILIYYLAERIDKRVMALITQATSLGLTTKLVHRKFLDSQSGGGVHQGIIAEVKPAKEYQDGDLATLLVKSTEPLILILDGITDPYNLGACLRTAYAAGVDLVIIPKDRSASLNATVKKVACGAAEYLPVVRVTNLARTICFLKERNIQVIGTTSDPKQRLLFGNEYQGALAIVMGSEGKGLRRLTREHCDELVSIPMTGVVSSLNVSVATGICLFEIVRQKTMGTG